jgi:hypothetical protein
MIAEDESKLAELLQQAQRDLNCLVDANRSTRSSAIDRLRKKLVPLDSKVRAIHSDRGPITPQTLSRYCMI